MFVFFSPQTLQNWSKKQCIPCNAHSLLKSEPCICKSPGWEQQTSQGCRQESRPAHTERVLQPQLGESRQANIQPAALAEGWGKLYWDEVGRKESLEEKKKSYRWKITDSGSRQDANAELFQQSFTPQDLRAPWVGEKRAAPMEVARGMLLLCTSAA